MKRAYVLYYYDDYGKFEKWLEAVFEDINTAKDYASHHMEITQQNIKNDPEWSNLKWEYSCENLQDEWDFGVVYKCEYECKEKDFHDGYYISKEKYFSK